jgi:hypothetical protein
MVRLLLPCDDADTLTDTTHEQKQAVYGGSKRQHCDHDGCAESQRGGETSIASTLACIEVPHHEVEERERKVLTIK